MCLKPPMIIHQEALCKSMLKLEHVVKVVVKLVNFTRAKGLYHRQFIQLLNDTGRAPGVSFISLRTHKTGLKKCKRHFPRKGCDLFLKKLDGRMCGPPRKL